MDKAGTITKGEPQVTDLVPVDGISEEELLTYAYALEKKSEHPLAKAILAKAEEKQITAREVSDFQALPGNGLRAVLDNEVPAYRMLLYRWRTMSTHSYMQSHNR